MLDKIRLSLAGELPAEYLSNLGNAHGLDGHCCGFLGVKYDDLVERVKKQRGSDEEILEWCFSHGLRPNPVQISVWNGFAEKFGWRDRAADFVARVKKEDGVEHHDDLLTAFDSIDYREGRASTAGDAG